MFELQRNIVFAKLKLINKLNSISSIDAYLCKQRWLQVTGAEGFVGIDDLGGDAVKLVDPLRIFVQQLQS